MPTLPTRPGLPAPPAFLEQFWQRQPLLARGGAADFACPLSFDDARWLATDDAPPDAPPTLLLETGGLYPWQLRTGPFDEADFEADRWLLEIPALDRLVSAFAPLLDRFAFLPVVRLAEVALVCAPAGAGPGPRAVAADVVLVQLTGRSRLEIGQGHRTVDFADVPLLDDFRPDASAELAPGDVVYLPPHTAHRAVALDAALTLRLTYRVPALPDLVAAVAADAAARLDPRAFLPDPPPPHSRRLSDDLLRRARSLVHALLSDDDALDRALGRTLTAPTPAALAPLPADAFPALPRSIEPPAAGLPPEGLVVRPGARRAWMPRPDGSAVLFVDGADYALPPSLAPLAPALADADRWTPDLFPPGIDPSPLLAALLSAGVLLPEAG